MRDPVTFDDLDALSAGASRSPGGGHRAAAEQLRRWAADPHPLDEPSPRGLLTESGQLLQLVGDDDAALEAFRQALSQPGHSELDPRCHIVEILHRRGEHAEADEVEHDLRRSRPRTAATYEFMGGLCEELGEDQRALGWYARGISLAEDEGLVEADMGGLCLQRWRLRERLGQDPDQFDEFGIDFHERVQRSLDGHT